VKLHADQLSDLDGAALVAEFDGLSADHVEYTSEASVRAMAARGTVAVLLPGAFLCLRETKLPPLAAFRAHGVPMAVATDCNPGTSPLLSLRLAMNMSCTLFRLTPEEALRGATVHAARALGLADRGRLAPGMRADFVRWRVALPAELSYWLAGDLAREVYCGGHRVA
jgi:imidazolonepropionase